VPHIKPKAEHQAIVLFHIVKTGLAYWEGWRDGRKNGQAEEAVQEPDKKSRKKSEKQNKAQQSHQTRKKHLSFPVIHPEDLMEDLRTSPTQYACVDWVG
jgi:hypothetical protein